MSPLTCADCDEFLADDAAALNYPAQPCPKCGSKKRALTLAAPLIEGLKIKPMKVLIQLVDYSTILLDEAKALIKRRQYGVAMVVAHMACEIEIQQAFTRAFTKRGITDLEKPVSRLFTGTLSRNNDRLCKVYVALTGDDITKQPFWSEYNDSVDRRNQCAHRGEKGTEQDAADSLRVCTVFVKHVKRT